jgi:hypothetical protein
MCLYWHDEYSKSQPVGKIGEGENKVKRNRKKHWGRIGM